MRRMGAADVISKIDSSLRRLGAGCISLLLAHVFVVIIALFAPSPVRVYVALVKLWFIVAGMILIWGWHKGWTILCRSRVEEPE